MEVAYSKQAKIDINFWLKSGNKKIQKKITELIHSIEKTPFSGIGKPEELKHELSGYWSRRINREHRIIYQVDETNKQIKISSLKGHY